MTINLPRNSSSIKAFFHAEGVFTQLFFCFVYQRIFFNVQMEMTEQKRFSRARSEYSSCSITILLCLERFPTFTLINNKQRSEMKENEKSSDVGCR